MLHQITEFYDFNTNTHYYANYDFDVSEGREGIHSVREEDEEIERRRVWRETNMGSGICLENGGNVGIALIEEQDDQIQKEFFFQLKMDLDDKSMVFAMTVEDAQRFFNQMKSLLKFAR